MPIAKSRNKKKAHGKVMSNKAKHNADQLAGGEGSVEGCGGGSAGREEDCGPAKKTKLQAKKEKKLNAQKGPT